MAKKYGDDYIEESSDVDDDKDGDYKQVECSEDDDDLKLTPHKHVPSMN